MNEFEVPISTQDCEKILIKDGVKNLNKIHQFKVLKFSENVLGFLAEHYKLIISYSVPNEGNVLKEKSFFVKAMPVGNDKQKEYINELGIFSKEINVYKKLISQFLKLSSKPFAAQYYFSNDNIMVLEDLSSKSFQNIQAKFLTLEQCKMALNAVARFHAASIILEELKSTDSTPYRIDNHFPKEIEECTFSFKEGHPRNKWLKTATRSLLELSSLLGKDQKVRDNISKFVSEDIPILLKPSNKFRNVVTHDDLWMNNLLFDGKESYIVDFQLTRFTPPTFDVLLLLYTCLTKKDMDEQEKNLLNYYYDVMEKEINNHGLNIEKLLPKAEFFESLEVYRGAALIEAVFYGTIIYLPKDFSTDMLNDLVMFEEFTFENRAPYVLDLYQFNDEYRSRLEHVLTSCLEHFEKC